jgi:prevent-host-death family protein
MSNGPNDHDPLPVMGGQSDFYDRVGELTLVVPGVTVGAREVPVNIVSIGELKVRLREYVGRVHDRHEEVTIEEGGETKAVLVDADHYYSMRATVRLLDDDELMQQIEAGMDDDRLFDMDDLRESQETGHYPPPLPPKLGPEPVQVHQTSWPALIADYAQSEYRSPQQMEHFRQMLAVVRADIDHSRLFAATRVGHADYQLETLVQAAYPQPSAQAMLTVARRYGAAAAGADLNDRLLAAQRTTPVTRYSGRGGVVRDLILQLLGSLGDSVLVWLTDRMIRIHQLGPAVVEAAQLASQLRALQPPPQLAEAVPTPQLWVPVPSCRLRIGR